MMLPSASPEIIPPSARSDSAPTDLLCYLYTLELKLPRQVTNKPLLIEVTT